MFKKGKIHGYGMMDNKKKKEIYEGYWMRNSMVEQIGIWILFFIIYSQQTNHLNHVSVNFFVQP